MTRPTIDSRQRLLDAAATAFAQSGFDGTSVDSIASRAGVNKAMIYYHFKSKQNLYLEVLRGIFAAIVEHTGRVAASGRSAPDKVVAFAEAIDAEADARPYLPPIMMREMTEGAARLDPDLLRLISRILGNLRTILEQGVREGTLRPAEPVLTYFSLIAPIIFFRVSAPIRHAMGRHHIVPGLRHLDSRAFLSHATAHLLRALAVEGVATEPRLPRQTRSGDHE